MKINILFGEKFCEKSEIEIDKYKTVKHFKSLICDLLKEKIGNNFDFIYGNIILNDEKLITFYNMKENDEIKIGKLEQFLNCDDVIVELFVAGWNATFIHLIVNKYDNCSLIKSIISTMIPECVNMWNRNGIEMRNEQVVNEIDLIGGYYKLIISDKSGDELDDDSKRKYEQCVEIHDRCLSRILAIHLVMNVDVICLWLMKSNINESRERIEKLRSVLSMNDLIAPRLNKTLSNLPASFVNCRLMFCTCMSDRLVDIGAEYWSTMIDQPLPRCKEALKMLFILSLNVALMCYTENRQSAKKHVNKTMKDIVIESLGYLIKILNNQNYIRIYSMEFFGAFSLRNYSNFSFYELTKDRLLIGFCFHSINIKNFKVCLYIPQQSIKTNIQLKKFISMQTNIPIDQLYLTKVLGAEQIKDDDKFDIIWNYGVQVVFHKENINELKSVGQGAFGIVQLYQDNLTLKKFVLKKPKKNSENLHREISIRSFIKNSSKISGYSQLFLDENKICVSMEYFSGGSLSSYLQKVGKLTENEIRKLSAQILIQLHELHFKGITHRDIKSDNVVFDLEMNAKLIDFGLSKFTICSSSKNLLEKRNQYTPGTLYYMAPELIKSEPYTNKIDIWSFGIMLVEMVTGKRPFYGCRPENIIIKLSKCTNIEYESPQPISKELKQFIDSCLNPNPKERPYARQLLKSNFVENYFTEIKNRPKVFCSFPEACQLLFKPVVEVKQNKITSDSQCWKSIFQAFSTILDLDLIAQTFK